VPEDDGLGGAAATAAGVLLLRLLLRLLLLLRLRFIWWVNPLEVPPAARPGGRGGSNSIGFACGRLTSLKDHRCVRLCGQVRQQVELVLHIHQFVRDDRHLMAQHC
jgi:hypothetical protein